MCRPKGLLPVDQKSGKSAENSRSSSDAARISNGFQSANIPENSVSEQRSCAAGEFPQNLQDCGPLAHPILRYHAALKWASGHVSSRYVCRHLMALMAYCSVMRVFNMEFFRVELGYRMSGSSRPMNFALWPSVGSIPRQTSPVTICRRACRRPRAAPRRLCGELRSDKSQHRRYRSRRRSRPSAKGSSGSLSGYL